MSAIEAELKDLMVRGLDGDAAAHRRLLSLLSVRLRAFFRRRLGDNIADVEDLVQETLMAVHTRRATYDRAQPFEAWVYAVARYKLIDHYRRAKVRATVPLEAAGAVFADSDVEAGTARSDLDRLLSTLPARQQALIRYVKIEGLSVAEAAERAGMSVSAVKVSVHRGLGVLSRNLRGGDGAD
ncbi:MAG: sigma-70 family RNA polymerase sigma factor [Caulobacteraceae bacterium]|nr:sigma-70 family RNA polymerase sigma factor [Caulobacteraceae bacterium]